LVAFLTGTVARVAAVVVVVVVVMENISMMLMRV
jgi:type IV secretory pathway VirB2 component (pilin)